MRDNAFKEIMHDFDPLTYGKLLDYGLTTVVLDQGKLVRAFTLDKEKLEYVRLISKMFGLEYKEEPSIGRWYSYTMTKLQKNKFTEKEKKILLKEMLGHTGIKYGNNIPQVKHDLPQELLEATQMAFAIISYMSIENFTIDLHENQYMRYNDYLICIDPIIFN